MTALARWFVAAALAAFAIQHALLACGQTGGIPGPPWVPAVGSAWLLALVLGLLAIALVLPKSASLSALLLGVVLLVRLLVVYLPRLVATPSDPDPITNASELLTMCGGAWVLAGELRAEQGQRSGRPAEMAARIGRFLFALPLVAFAVLHVIYAQFVARIVPAWIPGRLFWAYFAAAAFVAAAVAITTRIRAQKAAALLGIMFLLWVVILHLPRAIAAGWHGKEWTSLFVALAMSGFSFGVASAAAREGGMSGPTGPRR